MDDFLANFPPDHPIFNTDVPFMDIDLAGISEEQWVTYVTLVVRMEQYLATH